MTARACLLQLLIEYLGLVLLARCESAPHLESNEPVGSHFEQARPLDLISQPWIWIAFRAPALDLDCIFVGLDWILSKK